MTQLMNHPIERLRQAGRWLLAMLDGEELCQHAQAKECMVDKARKARRMADAESLRRAAIVLDAEGRVLLLSDYEVPGYGRSMGVLDGAVLVAAASYLRALADDLDGEVEP